MRMGCLCRTWGAHLLAQASASSSERALGKYSTILNNNPSEDYMNENVLEKV